MKVCDIHTNDPFVPVDIYGSKWKELLSEVASAKEKIEKLRKEDTLVFPVFTDLHTENVNHEYAQKLIAALELITGEIKSDAVINLGDNPAMLGRNIHITNSELKTVLEELLSAVHKASNCPLINVHGNHDAIGTDFFKADFWNDITKGKFGNTDAKYGDGAYYYLDYERANTRLIVLSMPYDSDIEAEHPTPLWAFGEKQLEWLKTTALDTESDIIILCHAPLYYYHVGDEDKFLGVWNGEKCAETSIANLCGWINDCDEAAEIINSYEGRQVACLSGHTHADSLWKPFEEKGIYKNPLSCHQVVTTGACLPGKDHTEFGISIDVAVWTPSEHTLNMIRIGDGDDRKIHIL